MSTALVTRAAPRFVKPIAQANGLVMWAGSDPNTVTTDVRLEWGTGAPNHTSPQGSVFIRTDASDSDTLFYRNTDAGTTWEAVVGSEVTDLLAATNTWAARQTLTTGALIPDAGSIQFGTGGADIVITADGTGVTVTGTDPWMFGDSLTVAWGVGSDFTIIHDGTNTILDSALVTATTKLRCGTDTSATAWQFENDSGTALLTVNGAGTITQADGTTIQRVGAGTGTGDVIERIGGTATEGLELVVFNAVISPAAVETAVLTVPAGSFVLSVQSNVQATLTGGGTTVTYSLGTTGDPDKYGTPASDALVQNTKSNFMGPFAFLPSAESIVLTGTATGGAADGDTALTVGSVRVRVVYYTLNSLDNA